MQNELLWANCGLELIHAKEAIKDLELYFTKQESSHRNEIILKSRLSAKMNIQKALRVLDPQVKQNLMDCLRKMNLLFLESGEESDSKNWYMKYVDSMFTRSNARRRELVQSSAHAPTPSPAVAAPTFSPTPSSSKVHYSQRPASPPLQQFFPTDLNDSSSQPEAGEPSPIPSSNVQSNKQNGNHKTVVVAVAVTAAVTFFVVALLFLCYFKVCGTQPGFRQNDESPLLRLSLSNYSIGKRKFRYHIVVVKSFN